MHHAGRTWVGGRIYVSDRRLYFCPGVLVRRRHGVLRLPLAAIAEVDTLGRRISIGALGDGGLKPRLQVITAAGERHAFTMRSLNRRTEQLRALLQPQRP